MNDCTIHNRYCTIPGTTAAASQQGQPLLPVLESQSSLLGSGGQEVTRASSGNRNELVH